MSCSDQKSAGKLRPRAWPRHTVAQHALRRTAHRIFRCFSARMLPLTQSLLLRRTQQWTLTEFQRLHVEYPPLLPDLLRTVWCAVVDENGCPLRSASGKPLTMRLFLEVAECTHTRRGRWAPRKQALWYFVAWDVFGSAVQRTPCRSRKAALALYNVPAERIGVPRSGDAGALVILPEGTPPKRSADPAPRAGKEGDHA